MDVIDGGGNHERGIALARIYKEDTIPHFVDSFMEMAEHDSVNRVGKIGEKLFKSKLRPTPCGMRDADSLAFDFQDFDVRDCVANIYRVGVAVNKNCFRIALPHTINNIHSYEIAAMHCNIGIGEFSLDFWMNFAPGVEVGIGDYSDSSWH